MKQEKIRKGFDPVLAGFDFIPFNDENALRAQIGPATCAVMLEPIQAEGGVVVPDQEYIKKLRTLCSERDILLIFDEVQTGMGRTGTLFAYEQFGVQPDIMTLAKGLGGGIPIGACLATDKVASAFEPGTHASTFGGNPLACATALKVVELLIEGKVLEQGRMAGDYLKKGLQVLQEQFSCILETRGRGLLQGLALSIDGKPLVSDCLDRRVIINCTAGRVLRFVPPLIISHPQIDRLLSVLSDVFSKRP